MSSLIRDKDVSIASASIAAQALDLGLVDEVAISLVPVLMGKEIFSRSGRRESNPHDQLGRLVTHPGRSFQLAAVTRRYTISTPLRFLFG